jgi:hypothetical protein
MAEKMQEYIDKEKILVEQNRFNNYQREYERKIHEADNDRLRSYFLEFSKEEDDGKIVQGAFSFLQFIMNKD